MIKSDHRGVSWLFCDMCEVQFTRTSAVDDRASAQDEYICDECKDDMKLLMKNFYKLRPLLGELDDR